MKLSIPKIEKNEQVFFLAYIIFLVFSLLMHSLYYQRFMYYYSYIIGGCIMILLLQEVARGALSFRSLLGAVVLFFLAFLLVLKGSGNLQTSFACVFVFAFGARDISFKKIGRVTIWVTLAVVIFVILSSMLGIIDNHHVLQSGGARSRYFLGFRYALNPPAMLLNVILLYVYVRRDECTYREIMAWLVLAWVCIILLTQDLPLDYRS